MNNKLFGLFLSLFFINQALADELFINNEFGESIRARVTYCRGTRTTQYMHSNHEIDVFLHNSMQAVVDLPKTKKIRLQEIRIETPSEIIITTFKDNKIKLPNVIVIKKDGIYCDGKKLAEYGNRVIIRKKAIALAATKNS